MKGGMNKVIDKVIDKTIHYVVEHPEAAVAAATTAVAAIGGLGAVAYDYQKTRGGKTQQPQNSSVIPEQEQEEAETPEAEDAEVATDEENKPVLYRDEAGASDQEEEQLQKPVPEQPPDKEEDQARTEEEEQARKEAAEAAERIKIKKKTTIKPMHPHTGSRWLVKKNVDGFNIISGKKMGEARSKYKEGTVLEMLPEDDNKQKIQINDDPGNPSEFLEKSHLKKIQAPRPSNGEEEQCAAYLVVSTAHNGGISRLKPSVKAAETGKYEKGEIIRVTEKQMIGNKIWVYTSTPSREAIRESSQQTNFTKKGLTAGWLQVNSNKKGHKYLQLISVNDKEVRAAGFSQEKTKKYITMEDIKLFKDPDYPDFEQTPQVKKLLQQGIKPGTIITVIDEGWDYDRNKPFFELSGYPNYRMYPVNDRGDSVLYEDNPVLTGRPGFDVS